MKRGVVLAAVSTHNAFFANHTQTYHHYNGTYRKNGHSGLHGANGTNLHGNVNMLLGGAMLAVVATVVFIVCYCCHRNIKRRSESIYRQQWFEADPNMEIFSVEQCFDTPSLYMEQRSDSGVSITSNQNGPPPSYEAVVALDGIRKCSNVNCPLGKTMNINDNNDDDINKNGLILEDMEPPSHTDDGLNNDDNDKFYGDKCNKNNNNFDDDQEQQQQQFTCHRCTTTRQSDAPNQSNNNLCDCNNLIDGGTLCRNCGEYITDNVVTNCTQIDGNNKCYYDYLTSVSNPNGQIVDEDNNTEHDHQQQQQHQIEMLNNVNNNNSMGTGDDSSIQQINYNNTNNNNGDMASNRSNNETMTTGNDNNNNNNATTTSVDLQSFNENGLIRLDMSQIIDSTGLPTYEAAIKLEQSGYV